MQLNVPNKSRHLLSTYVYMDTAMLKIYALTTCTLKYKLCLSGLGVGANLHAYLQYWCDFGMYFIKSSWGHANKNKKVEEKMLKVHTGIYQSLDRQ